MDGDTKPTKSDAVSAEKGPCCPCPKTKEDLLAEAKDRTYRKVFENFLHNSIFTPRYDTCTHSEELRLVRSAELVVSSLLYVLNQNQSFGGSDRWPNYSNMGLIRT